MPHWRHMLLTQRFVPEMGGAIRWMLEVYRRWPEPVDVVAHDYYTAPHRRREFPDAPQRPAAGDHVVEPMLRMDRRDIFLHDWGLTRWASLVRYRRMMRAVAQRLEATGGQAGQPTPRPSPGGKGRVVVHCTHAVPEAAALILLKRRYRDRLRIVSYAHGEEITSCQSSRQLRWLLNRACGVVDLMIANSANTARLLEPHIDASKVHVVHPGVDIAAFADARARGQQWRHDAGLDDRLIVLTVGRLDPRKNQMAVLEAVNRLARRYPNLVYVIAGDGQQADALRARAVELNISDQVQLLGAVDGELKTALFGACDVFAMPAIQDGTDVEGFGLVFLEAGACGKPSVAGSAGGQAEAVLDGRTGLVVDGRDGDAVTAALDKLLGDASLRTRLGEAALAYAREHDWQRVADRTIELVRRRVAADIDGGG